VTLTFEQVLSPRQREVLGGDDKAPTGRVSAMVRYDNARALLLAEHAAAVYLPGAQYRAACEAAGYQWSLTLENTDTQVGVAWAPWGAVIVPRGSSACGDWRENLWLLRRSYPETGAPKGARVHAGFRFQAEKLREQLVQVFKLLREHWRDAPREFKPRVWIAGHSLGAALCTMVRAFAEQAELPVAGVYAFAMPRTGNAAWARWYDDNFPGTYRVVVVRHEVQDLVTRVPLSAWGYRHVGLPVVVRQGQVLLGNDAWARVRAGAASPGALDQWRILSRLAVGVQCHLATNLVADLRACLKEHPEP
jgi:hypothetical protein